MSWKPPQVQTATKKPLSHRGWVAHLEPTSPPMCTMCCEGPTPGKVNQSDPATHGAMVVKTCQMDPWNRNWKDHIFFHLFFWNRNTAFSKRLDRLSTYFLGGMKQQFVVFSPSTSISAPTQHPSNCKAQSQKCPQTTRTKKWEWLKVP